ncbi:MAG: peroxiredoxin-like family protein [Pirellulales bacterium]
MPCREHLLQLQQQEQAIRALDLQVAAVTFEAPERAKAYVAETNFPWPLLVDRSRAVYRAYGMNRGSFWQIWGPQNWGVYLRLMLRGRKPRRPRDDINQLGGDVLIDDRGVVRLHHVGQGPADRPTVSSLLDIVSNREN